MTETHNTEGVIVLGLFFLIYFLPWLIALFRSHRNVVAIFVLNLLLGWTVLGWILTLVWSFTNSVIIYKEKPNASS